MGWMDGVKKGMKKAKGEAQDLARVTRLRGEVSKLKRDRVALFREMGEEIYAMHRRGESTLGFGSRCQSVEALDESIAAKEAEIEAIRD